MTQLVLNIEDASILSSLKKIIGALNGVSIAKPVAKKTQKSGIDKGLEDIKKGNVYQAKDSADLVNQIFG